MDWTASVSCDADFADKVAVITGGARGQGLAHAAAFAARGAAVVVLDTRKGNRVSIPYGLATSDDFAQAQAKLSSLNDACLIIDADVSDRDAVATAFADVETRLGRVDVLVNNAGINSLRTLAELDESAWQDVLEVNLLGSCWTMQAAAPIMARSGGGRIINIASMAAIKATPRQAHYAASKAALIAMGRTLAVELGQHNITVNAICPTLVRSPQTVGLARVSKTPGGFSAPYVLPQVTSLAAEDVSAVVLWLASDAARYITGHVVPIDIGSAL